MPVDHMHHSKKSATRLVSIIVPVFNEEGNIAQLYRSIIEHVPEGYEYEFIFVDDGSRDDSLQIIKNLGLADSRVRFAAFSRNFGHQMALKAGIDLSRGDCTITLDADFQHPVRLLPEMLHAWEGGAEVVSMLREYPAEYSFKAVTSRIFYRIINSIIDFPIKPGSADFRLTDRKVTDELAKINENTLFLRGLIPWMGFRQTEIHYRPDARLSGESKYSFKRMMSLALTGIVSSSTRPLRMTTYLGMAIASFASIYAVYALVIKLVAGTAISGWTSLLISLLLLGGTQLVMLGIIGEYLGKTLAESKARPGYIIREQSQVDIAPAHPARKAI